MIERQVLVDYLNSYLNCSSFKDYAPNGLQVEGALNISTICTAVTASLEAIEQAAALGAQALLVHHGYFWRGESPNLVGMRYQRIARLIENKLNLLAYHLPLDCHLELGNNICLGRKLNLHNMSAHEVNATPHLLWTGSFAETQTAEEVGRILMNELSNKPIHISGNSATIQQVAWCTGAAQDFIEDAAALGVDAFISGEISERTYYQAKELGMHYFAAGHHATERFGIQALGAHLAQKFNLNHQFIDSKNPV